MRGQIVGALSIVALAGCASVLGFEDSTPTPSCDKDADCPAQQRCVTVSGGGAQNGGRCAGELPCTNPGATSCSDTCECPSPLACASDRRCRVVCNGGGNPGPGNPGDQACGSDQRCVGDGPTDMNSNVCVGTDPARDPRAGTDDGGVGDGGGTDGSGDGAMSNVTDLAMVNGQVGDLVTDGNFVYWIESNGSFLRALSTMGGTPTPIVLGSPLRGLAIGSDGLYFGNGNRIQKCPRSNAPCSPALVASGLSVVWAIAIEGPTLFYKDAQNGDIGSCATNGCGSTPTILTTMNGGSQGGITANPSGVYWTNSFAGNVMTCPITGCTGTPTVLYNGGGTPDSIAVDGANLFWATGQVLFTCMTPGCTPKSFPATAPSASHLVLAGTDLYWVDQADMSIRTCPAPSCSSARTVVSQQNVSALAVDGSFVYFVGGDGHLRKAPR
jgi:hypothetical protein